jgi:pantothenate kinase
MMTWHDEFNDEEWRKLVARTEKAIIAMNEKCVRQFNETVRRVEAEDTEQKIRQLLGDTLGHRTYMVEVERG